MKPNIEVSLRFKPEHAKFLLPAVGVLAGYGGAFVAAHMAFIAVDSAWLAAPLTWLGFCFAGTVAMIPVDNALGENAAHVNLLHLPLYWTGAALLLLGLHWFFAMAFAVAVPGFVDNLWLWGSGALAIWAEEPNSSLLSWLKRLAVRKGPPRN